MAAENTVKEKTMKALLRGEITVNEVTFPLCNIYEAKIDDYHPSWDDVDAFLSFLEEKDPLLSDLFQDWGIMFMDPKDYELRDEDDDDGEDAPEGFDAYLRASCLPVNISEHFIWNTGEEMEKYPRRMDFLGVTSPGDGRRRIFECIADMSASEDSGSLRAVSSGAVDIRRIREDIELIKAEDWDRNITGWKWTDCEKLEALSHAEGYGFGGPCIDPDEMEEARTILNELCARENAYALHLRAYSAYGGSYIWPCDWKTSRDTLLHLMEMPDVDDERKAEYANTLGYIYYYGRCSDGKPDYDMALKYFTIGNAGGVTESRYKLSDMMRYGKGMPKNPGAALNLLMDAYDSSRESFLRGYALSEYADTALRLSSILSEMGKHVEAVGALLEADYAMTVRRNAGDLYGDESVAFSIKKALSTERALIDSIPMSEVQAMDITSMFGDMLRDGIPAEGKVSKDEDGNTVLDISASGDMNLGCFVTIPVAGYCMVLGELHYTFMGLLESHVRGNRKSFLYDRYEVEVTDDRKIMTVIFYRDDRETARFRSESLSLWLPDNYTDTTGSAVHRIASCSFEEGGRTYDYLADDVDVKPGDKAIVDTWNGETVVHVEAVSDVAEDDLPLGIGSYKKIVRIAD